MGCCCSRREEPEDLRSLLSNARGLWLNISECDYPLPCPPKSRKEDMYPGRFYLEVDRHTLKVPKKKLQAEIVELANHLVRNCNTDIDCARALFRYVTSVDIHTILEKYNNTIPENSGLDYFSRLKAHTYNHAMLYKDLARSIGLPCVVIDGISKNSEYEIGGTINRKAMAHQWNAVYLDNQWRLLDPLWGSACMIGERSNQWSIINVDGEGVNFEEDAERGQKCRLRNDFFFLTDPDMFICTHLPNQSDWQLLPSPVSFKQFQEFVYVREQFFKTGLFMLPESYQKCNIQSYDGEVAISFGIPAHKSQWLEFKYLLFFNTRGKKKPVHNYDNIVLFEKDSNKVTFNVWLPFSGKFRFDVFCREEDDREKFDLAFSYVIHCSMPKENFSGIPFASKIGWGPGIEAKKAGLQPLSHHSAVVRTKEGKTQVRFKVKEAVNIFCQLKSNDIPDTELEKYVLTTRENGEVNIEVKVPQKGQTALCVVASNPRKDKAAPNVCNYLLKTPQSCANAPFPWTPSQSVGNNWYECQRMNVTCLNSIGVLDCEDGVLSLSFISCPETEILANLNSNYISQESLAESVTVTQDENTTTVELCLDSCGEYTLNIFGRNSNEKRVYPLHSYLIKNKMDVLDLTSMRGTHSIESVQIQTEKKVKKVILLDDSHETVVSYRMCSVLGAADHIPLTFDDGNHAVKAHLPEFTDYALEEFSIVKEGCLVRIRSHKIKRAVDERPISLLEPPSSRQKDGVKRPSRQLLRTQLRMALVTKNFTLLDVAIAKIQRHHYENLIPEMKRALRKHKVESTSLALSEAMTTQNIKKLEATIEVADRERMAKEIGLKLVVARRILNNVLKKRINKMNQGTIAEVKSYQAPPEVVKSVMAASFLLLGEDEKQDYSDWESIRREIGNTSKMKTKLKERSLDTISTEKIQKAKEILSGIEGSKVRKVSEVASAFFAWSSNILQLNNPDDQSEGSYEPDGNTDTLSRSTVLEIEEEEDLPTAEDLV